MEPAAACVCPRVASGGGMAVRPQQLRNTAPSSPQPLTLPISVTPLLVSRVRGSSLDSSDLYLLKSPHPAAHRLSLFQTKSAEGLSRQPPKAPVGGKVPEFWVHILQVPLEALAAQFPPQVHSAVDAGGEQEDRTQPRHRQVPGWVAHRTACAPALRPPVPRVLRK